MRDENQLHAAVVELVALDDAEIKYSTVQNWYPGDAEGKGGIYNFVTKRADCRGDRSKVSWTQVETGSAITWKYPSCILRGDGSRGEFYSIAITNNRQQADTGTKMIHLGANTPCGSSPRASRPAHSSNTYRGLVSAHPKAKGARNFTQCDSLLIGKHCAAHTVPYIEARNGSAGSSTRRRPPGSPRTSCSTPCSAAFRRRRRCAAGQRLRQGRAAGAADGVRGRGPEAGGDQPGGERGMNVIRRRPGNRPSSFEARHGSTGSENDAVA